MATFDDDFDYSEWDLKELNEWAVELASKQNVGLPGNLRNRQRVKDEINLRKQQEKC